MQRSRPRGKCMYDIMVWSGLRNFGEVKRLAEERDSWRVVVAKLRNEEGTRKM